MDTPDVESATESKGLPQNPGTDEKGTVAPTVGASTPKPEVNWDAIGAELTTTLRDQISDLVESGQADVSAYAGEISSTIVTAVRTGKHHLVDECRHQLRVLAEIHRIRFVGAGLVIVDKLMTTAAKVAMTMAAGLPGLV